MSLALMQRGASSLRDNETLKTLALERRSTASPEADRRSQADHRGIDDDDGEDVRSAMKAAEELGEWLRCARDGDENSPNHF